jgi:RNA polymerase sigma factor (sigma-70 family)
MNPKNFRHLSDEDLVSKIITDELPELFDIIFSRYHSKVYEKCLSLLKNRQLADEFAEDILSKAFEKLKGFKGNSTFGSWLYSITYNHCIDYLRMKKKLHYPEWNSSQELPEIIDETAEDLSGIRYENLIKIMDMLHTEEKALLLMKYQDDLSIKQISEALRLSEGAVKMRIKRSKARLLYLHKMKYGSNETLLSGS